MWIVAAAGCAWVAPRAAAADELADALRGVQDHVFTFDDTAFYLLCRRAATEDSVAFNDPAAKQTVPWQFLLERPSDYRGRLVCVEGVLRGRQGFTVGGLGREGLGTLHQCELFERGTKAVCTIIAVRDPAAIPLHARVRALGFFLKVRAFRDLAGETGFAPLLVARELTCVSAPRGIAQAMSSDRWSLLNVRRPLTVVSWTALLVCAGLLIRGWRRARRLHPVRRSAGEPAGADDFDWLEDAGGRS